MLTRKQRASAAVAVTLTDIRRHVGELAEALQHINADLDKLDRFLTRVQFAAAPKTRKPRNHDRVHVMLAGPNGARISHIARVCKLSEIEAEHLILEAVKTSPVPVVMRKRNGERVWRAARFTEYARP